MGSKPPQGLLKVVTAGKGQGYGTVLTLVLPPFPEMRKRHETESLAPGSCNALTGELSLLLERPSRRSHETCTFGVSSVEGGNGIRQLASLFSA